MHPSHVTTFFHLKQIKNNAMFLLQMSAGFGILPMLNQGVMISPLIKIKDL